jgi:hypothetical protein
MALTMRFFLLFVNSLVNFVSVSVCQNNMNKIPVGISSCLLGQAVRYDGGHKLDSYIVGTLTQYFDFKPFCPEVAIGMGTPRPTIQLVKMDNEIRSLGVKNPDFDATDPLRGYANGQKAAHDGLCGYILKKAVWNALRFTPITCHKKSALVFMPRQ